MKALIFFLVSPLFAIYTPSSPSQYQTAGMYYVIQKNRKFPGMQRVEPSLFYIPVKPCVKESR